MTDGLYFDLINTRTINIEIIAIMHSEKFAVLLLFVGDA